MSESCDEGVKSSKINTFYLDVSGITKTPEVAEYEEYSKRMNLAAELLRYHQKFGHTNFKKTQIMARLGTIMKKL